MTSKLTDEQIDQLIPVIFERPYETLITGRHGILFDIEPKFLPDETRKYADYIKTKFQAGSIINKAATYSLSPDFQQQSLPSIAQDIACRLLSIFSPPSLQVKETEAPKVTATQTVSVELLDPLPDLGHLNEMSADSMFSVFLPSHQAYAEKLVTILTDLEKTPKKHLLATLIYYRENINPQLFVYAATIALQRRPDTKKIKLPPHHRLFPHTFLSSEYLTKARQQALYLTKTQRESVLVPMNLTATNLDPEQNVAYWREDVGLNQHYWHWHTVYPHWDKANSDSGKRRGELFYYMHQQILARYDFERLSNGLARCRSFDCFRKPVAEGYFPKLDNTIGTRLYPSRQPGSVLRDIKRNNFDFKITDLERWRDLVVNAIYKGYVEKGGKMKKTKLFEAEDGIKFNGFGNMIEANALSPYKELYGDLQNLGHVLFACIHDPDHRFMETMGIMGDLATATRDPLFYVWHRFINDIFVKYKYDLPSYTDKELDFPGIEVQEVKLKYKREDKAYNKFYTYFDTVDVDIQSGINFQEADGPVNVRLIHLQHRNFSYEITVNNTTGKSIDGTVRIFLAPKCSESRSNVSSEKSKSGYLPFEEQRHLMIELDKYSLKLESGKKTYSRSSNASSVTIPFDKVFNDSKKEDQQKTGEDEIGCKCGWPDYLLIPRGRVEGLPSQLFVMITEAETHLVNHPETRKDALSYCGLEGKPYPDSKPMGFPFDRKPDLPWQSDKKDAKVPSDQYFLDQFQNRTKNMTVLDTFIHHAPELPEGAIKDKFAIKY